MDGRDIRIRTSEFATKTQFFYNMSDQGWMKYPFFLDIYGDKPGNKCVNKFRKRKTNNFRNPKFSHILNDNVFPDYAQES